MRRTFGSDQNFINDFRANGYFLDDLILTPVNKMLGRERIRLRHASVPSLAERLSKYQPQAVVALMIGIEPMVRKAVEIANLSECQVYATPFPGNGHCTKFRAAMAEILPQLPKAMIAKNPARTR